MQTKYNPTVIEEGKNKKGVDKKYFSTHDLSKEPFTIILPPPNVTGQLHLGHAGDGFIQDTIIRYKKLHGFDVLFIPGMDHAGIATQAKVEQKLRENNLPNRFELGREKFLEKVGDGKEEYATRIRTQGSKLGLALDYSSERFTMDDGLSISVSKVFIKMYNDGLIYKGKRAINGDPKLQTVLSNIEVISEDKQNEMVYIKYKIVNGDFILVATTRPETMFSDVAIAVNPNDEVMNKYIGKEICHPLTGKILPIIGDEYIKIGKGTGAMKVSAHAVADIDIIKNNKLEINECIDKLGNMNKLAGELEGLNRFDARKKVVEILKEKALIEKVEVVNSAVGHSERSGEVVEILVQDQWFVNMKPLAKKILDNLESEEKVEFFPSRFENVIKSGMDKIQDGTISRQLGGGHRLPVGYKDEEVKVQIESPGIGGKQDDDVLDTGFSSGLAPFSFLGGPNDNEKVNRYYPTSLLVTGYDIIFFGVARMYFQGLNFMNEIPFKHVLIHGLIRAEDGRKMSKSLGNGIEPMEVIEKYGSDSLRGFLLTNSTPGQDIRFSKQKIESSGGLANKLGNISRFIIDVMPESSNNSISEIDEGIQIKLDKLEKKIDKSFKTYEFTIVGKEFYTFIMEDFSSGYIELSKANPNKAFAKKILSKLLVILHPFMPFITDHIFTLLTGKEILEQNILNTNEDKNLDPRNVDDVIEVVKYCREFREEFKVPKKEIVKIGFSSSLSDSQLNMITKLANAELCENDDSTYVCQRFSLYIKLSDEVKTFEKERILKEIKKLESEILRASKMLSNDNFISKAPENKINEEKDKLERFKKDIKILKEKFNG